MTKNANSTDDSAQSPCVRNCCLDDNDLCLGCFRLLPEILRWTQFSEGEKRAVLAHCALRKIERSSKFR